MATTYTASLAAATAPARGYGQAGDCKVRVATYELTGALVINDVIQMVKVPSGAVIAFMYLSTDDLDTNGTPLITLDVGDGGDVNRYIAASTIGRAGGTTDLSALVIGGLGYTYTTEDTIDVHVPAAPATGATTGTITLVVGYTLDA